MAALNTKASKEYYGDVTIRFLADAGADVSRNESSVYIYTLRYHSF